MTKLIGTIGALEPGQRPAVELADVLAALTDAEQTALDTAVAGAIDTAVTEALATIDGDTL